MMCLSEIRSAEEQPKKKGRKKKEAPAKDYKEVLWAECRQTDRNQMDAAVYKHLVLGMIFLKYISDAFP